MKISNGIIFLIIFLTISLINPSSAKAETEVWCHDFLIDLKSDQKGKEVEVLQLVLKEEKLFKKSATGYFGPLTFEAVKLFQEKYKKEILVPQKLKRGTGFVGIATRSKLNELYGCSKVYVSSFTPQQGDTLLIKVKTNEEISGKFNSRKINFFKFRDQWIGILGISAKEKLGKSNLVIDFPEGTFLKKELVIKERKFSITELSITEELKEKGLTPSKIEENVAKENQKISQILQIFSPFYFNQNFIYPLKEIEVVGEFGNIRKSGKIALQHLGVDLKADVGTPVYAINDGIIRFSQELTNYGKTIIIDHGMGIFSIYLHLDEFKVLLAQEIKRGDIIALSGNTGYSIKPHLHFSVKINGASVDPLRFIELTEKELKR